MKVKGRGLCLSSLVMTLVVVAAAASSDERTDNLIKDLTSRNPEKRAEAAWDLGQLKAAQAVPFLTAALSDKEDRVRANAAAALWNIGDPSRPALPELRKLLRDPSGRVRINAAGALHRMDVDRSVLIPPMRELLADRNPFLAVDAADRLIALGVGAEEVRPTLERAMRSRDTEVRRHVMKTLLERKKLPRGLAPVLIEGVDDRDDVVQAHAVVALHLLGVSSPQIVSAFRRALKRGDATVRPVAIMALSSIKAAQGATPEARSVLSDIQEALKDRDGDVRAAAAEAVGKSGATDPVSVQKLISALADREAKVRESAAEALGEIGKPAKVAIPELWALWNNPKENNLVRHGAGRALGKLGEKVDWQAEDRRLNPTKN
jgi:HEAT repeat protein